IVSSGSVGSETSSSANPAARTRIRQESAAPPVSPILRGAGFPDVGSVAVPSAELVRVATILFSPHNTVICAPETAADCGSSTLILILRSAASATRDRNREKEKTANTRIPSSLARERG